MVYCENLIHRLPAVNKDVNTHFNELKDDLKTFKELTATAAHLNVRGTLSMDALTPSGSLVNSLRRLLDSHRTLLTTKLDETITVPLTAFLSECERKRLAIVDESHSYTNELKLALETLASKREVCMAAYKQDGSSRNPAKLNALADMFADFEALTASAQQQQDVYYTEQVPAILCELEKLEKMRLDKEYEMVGVFLNHLLAYGRQVTSIHRNCSMYHRDIAHSTRIIQGFAANLATSEGTCFKSVPRLPVSAASLREGRFAPSSPPPHLDRRRSFVPFVALHEESCSASEVHDKPVSTLTRQIFNALDLNGSDSVSSAYLLRVMERNGLLRSDPRLKTFMESLESFHGVAKDVKLSLLEFDTVIHTCATLVHRCVAGQLRIPEFGSFCDHLRNIYQKVLANTSGRVANYIPQLAKVNPEQFSISVTTVDGQHFSIGDSDVSFSIQSCSKPVSYLLALQQWGSEYVHKYIGFEASGRRFNDMVLKEVENPEPTGPQMIPHNPMINSGAISIMSMIYPELKHGERLEKVMETWRSISGGGTDGDVVGYDQDVYNSESGSADRNWCLGYMMKEKRSFPPCFTTLPETLELYFQCCSITSTNRAMSMMAATLANGGLNPRSSDRAFSASNVRRVLPLMMSAGLYDYSGQWAYEIGVPAKSGVGGCIFFVIPNVCGISVWSPRLDSVGNSARAVQVASELLKTFRFHSFEVFSMLSPKIDPTFTKNAQRIARWTEISGFAFHGDSTGLERAAKEGVDLYGTDYDSRSLMHITASEGHLDALTVLVNHAPRKDLINWKDRWGATPLDDALRGRHRECVALLECAGAVASGIVFPDVERDDYDTTTSSSSLQAIFAAADGDLDELVRLAASGADLTAADYDGRTALHLANSNAHRRCVDYLLTRHRGDVLQKLMVTRDRWGHTAMPGNSVVPPRNQNWNQIIIKGR